MTKEKEVYITEQTFQDAGGREIFGKLKMIGPVYVEMSKQDGFWKEGSIRSYLKADEKLIELAKFKKAEYIFDVKYKIIGDKVVGNKILFAKGTAYKKRSLLGRLG
jgi:hypothetical protein